MAQKVVVQLIDDLDGTPLTDGEGSTVSFSLEGTSYEIDLSKENADKLRAALAPYISAARRANSSGGRRGTRPSAPAKHDTAAIREWAKSHGLKVSERGRIAADVLAQYEARARD